MTPGKRPVTFGKRPWAQHVEETLHVLFVAGWQSDWFDIQFGFCLLQVEFHQDKVIRYDYSKVETN